MKKPATLIALLVCLIGASWFYYSKTQRSGTTQTADTSGDNAADGAPDVLTLTDYNDETLQKWLTATETTKEKKIAAAKELGRRQKPAGFMTAKDWLATQKNDDQYRAAALEVLLNYQDAITLPVYEMAMPILNEPEQLQILKMLSDTSTPERQTWIKNISTTQQTSFFAIAAQLKSGLVDQNTMAQLKKHAPTTQMRLIKVLTERAASAKSPLVKSWLVNMADRGTTTELQTAAIAALAKLNSKEYATKVTTWVTDKSPDVRAAAIASIPELCPTNRWDILTNTAKNESSDMVLAHMFNALMYLQGQDADQIVATLQTRSASLSLPIQKRFIALKKDFKATQRGDRCAK